MNIELTDIEKADKYDIIGCEIEQLMWCKELLAGK